MLANDDPLFEPTIPAEELHRALQNENVEQLRPLLPVGYAAGVDAYRQAAAALDAHALSTHYTEGLSWFHGDFVPALRRRIEGLVGGAWDLSNHVAFAAGSDVDLIAHVVNAATLRGDVNVYPGDWWGFASGSLSPERVRFSTSSGAQLAAICVPSVRNGHTTGAMLDFLASARTRILNINLLPTLSPKERNSVATSLAPLLSRSLLSISFSRGFGLTASQLGVLLAPKAPGLTGSELIDELGLARPLEWTTYFYNRIAAMAFLAIDLDRLAATDTARRAFASQWLRDRGLPVVESGSYYVKAFRFTGALPERLLPLERNGLVRICLKPS
ncbi:MAG: hypothetical protein HY791_08845 [Deltaproteobacteria bacterium]|nr:hypothetical protein [Deltaproteobacteria bacterium]